MAWYESAGYLCISILEFKYLQKTRATSVC